ARYQGKGVRRAVQNVIETIAPEVEGMDATEQAQIDRALLELAATPTKSGLGATALLVASLPVAPRPAVDRGFRLSRTLAAPARGGNEAALDFLMRAIERAGYRAGEEVWLALDVAASEFGERGRYRLRADRAEKSSEEMIAFYESLLGRYPIRSIEDGLGED